MACQNSSPHRTVEPVPTLDAHPAPQVTHLQHLVAHTCMPNSSAIQSSLWHERTRRPRLTDLPVLAPSPTIPHPYQVTDLQQVVAAMQQVVTDVTRASQCGDDKA